MTLLASLITPGDFVGMTLMLMAPLVLLYELSIAVATLIYRRRSAEGSVSVSEPEDSVPLAVALWALAEWRARSAEAKARDAA